MKVTTTPSMTPTRRPARPMEPLSLPPPYVPVNSNGSSDLGSMAAAGIGISCRPVSIPDGGTNHPIQRQPVCHQLFRSLDTSVHHHHNFCNHGGCNPNNANTANYPNNPRKRKNNDGIPLVVSPSPPRSSPPLPFWTTPPPSPFGSKTTTPHSSFAGTTTTLLKTPSSVRTAETESIVSSASTTPLRDRDGSSPVPSRTTATTTTRPRTTLVPSLPGNSPCRQGPLFSALLPHPPLANGGSAANMRSNHQHNTKKPSKNRVLDLLPPAAAQQAYDHSNHSRHSIHSTCSRSNNSSPSLGLNDSRSSDSVHSNSNSNSVHSSSYAAGSSTHHKSKTTSSNNNNNNNNSNRSKKVKTELCLYYLNNEPCPYGDGCHYAHGQEELQTKGLLDLQNLGLIEDASTYRIKPCFSHVAMGSCPFGKRCACLHDPRVTGTVQSWLPITETQGNNIVTDINVEGLHQKRRFDILYGDPFVGESRLSAALMTCGGNGDGSPYDYRYDWTDLYHMVANIQPTGETRSSSGTGTRRRGGASGIRNTTIGIHHTTRRQNQSIWEVHKLSMALQMHGGTHRWMYKYRPSHMIFNEHCMVLDKRAFRLDEASGKAIPLPLSKYRPEHPHHCIVREIAFGPDQDPSVRPVALWFNISGDKVTECTLHKQKLFRWHKNKKASPSKTAGTPDSRKGFSSSPFDGHDSFVMVRPIDREAFGLVRDILEHRYATVLAKGIKSIRGRSETLERLGTEYYLLQEHFSNLKRHWRAWDYPRAAGRPPIDEHAPVPPADATYEPVHLEDADPPEALEGVHNKTQELWESFVRTLEASKRDDAEEDDEDWSGHDCETANNAGTGTSYLLGPFRPPVITPRVEHRPPRPRRRNRLSVFVRLSRGQGENRPLPHITHRHGTSSEGGNAKGEKGNHKPKDSYSRQSERCWKSLFLPNDALQEAEWDVVVNHFTNSSRSQKVLNIVQQ